ncbi:MAG TPA: crossover junction endodeoxyribonuclease RuvC [Sedimenticola thiotaurini]|uniref:Crossover junction endodeoxyribonuclease RuvC n=1 Tax=Sedimenticola thiotaurini TaxID=1543721 RepID=A0A831W3G2_9GAMM|nr:crossover junction endodeoxyribonuclease RuvC [Sedimenticola thiotaurini]
MRRILGIDPGSRTTGYGIIASDGMRSVHVASGCIRVDGRELPRRLGEIFRQVSDVVREFAPEEMAIEQVFMARNAASALKLGQARGAAICAGVTAGLPVFEYSPRSVKLSVVGTGAADKAQVQHMVARLLDLRQKLAEDQADALAVALSHAHAATTLAGIVQGGGGWRR